MSPFGQEQDAYDSADDLKAKREMEGQVTTGVSHAGRKKEKEQRSERIDKALMDLAYAQVAKTGERITDFLERGLVLALYESTDLPTLTNRVRFLLPHANPKEQKLVQDLLALLRMPLVKALTPFEKAWRDMILAVLDEAETRFADSYAKALAEYRDPSSEK